MDLTTNNVERCVRGEYDELRIYILAVAMNRKVKWAGRKIIDVLSELLGEETREVEPTGI